MLATALLALMAVTQTDQTVQVQKGTRLDINNFAGDVSIKVWDKDAVRVQVTHSDRETIDIKPGDQSLLIRSHSSRGPQRSLDYQITVPKWMPISVNGIYADVTLEGTGGDLTIDTNRGDIKLINAALRERIDAMVLKPGSPIIAPLRARGVAPALAEVLLAMALDSLDNV